jgi:hypothetical protein
VSDPRVDTQPVTVGEMRAFAKSLRLKAYYDVGDAEGESERAATVREARSSTLVEVAEAVDLALGIDTELTQEDLESWRR